MLNLQPLKSIQQYPQWETIDADLILIGNPQTNPLIFDQSRGRLLDGRAVQVTFSPFVGEYQCLNIIAADTATSTKLIGVVIE